MRGLHVVIDGVCLITKFCKSDRALPVDDDDGDDEESSSAAATRSTKSDVRRSTSRSIDDRDFGRSNLNQNLVEVSPLFSTYFVSLSGRFCNVRHCWMK